jgi:hypothetical protein
MWYGLIQPSSGDLVSVGTETMFPESNIDAFNGVYDRVQFGETKPDFSTQMWNPTTRLMVERPIPLLISRLDDIEAWLQSDADWLAVWNTLSQARRTQIRTGLRRVLNRVLGPQQWRGESETVEL